MSDRLSDALVANLAVWAADAKPTTREVEALAREVQQSRKTLAAIRAALADFSDPVPPASSNRYEDGWHDALYHIHGRLLHPEGDSDE